MGDAAFHVIVKTQTRRNLRRYLRFGFRIQTNKSKFRRLFHVVLRFLVSTSALHSAFKVATRLIPYDIRKENQHVSGMCSSGRESEVGVFEARTQVSSSVELL